MRRTAGGYTKQSVSHVDTCYCGEQGNENFATNFGKPNQPGQRGKYVKVLSCCGDHQKRFMTEGDLNAVLSAGIARLRSTTRELELRESMRSAQQSPSRSW